MTRHLCQSARRSKTTQAVSGGSPGKGRLWRRGHDLESIGKRWTLASVNTSRLRLCVSWQAWKGDWKLACYLELSSAARGLQGLPVAGQRVAVRCLQPALMDRTDRLIRW